MKMTNATTKEALKKIGEVFSNKKTIKKMLLPALLVLIVGGIALVAYNIIKGLEQEKQQANRNQAVQQQEAKRNLIKLEKCVVENFANAHGDSNKVWGYVKIMCELSDAEVDKLQKEWGENLELLKKKKEDEALLK